MLNNKLHLGDCFDFPLSQQYRLIYSLINHRIKVQLLDKHNHNNIPIVMITLLIGDVTKKTRQKIYKQIRTKRGQSSNTE